MILLGGKWQPEIEQVGFSIPDLFLHQKTLDREESPSVDGVRLDGHATFTYNADSSA